MDCLTILATATAVTWVFKGGGDTDTANRQQQRQRPKHRMLPWERRLQPRLRGKWPWWHAADGVRAVLRSFLYRSVYLPYRSVISRLMGWLLWYPVTFVCDCCCLALGGQDVDREYRNCCRCYSAAKKQYCYTCIANYVETQVTDGQATRPVCMVTRKCQLDDRVVRQRLSPSAVLILDRNQIIEAAALETKRDTSTEILWHCPSPDCAYAAFISNRTSPHPERITLWQSWTRWLPQFYRARPTDLRCIRCLVCKMTSCQFCHLVWSKGAADHTDVTCDAYAAQLRSMDADSAQQALLQVWKAKAGIQSCRHCHSAIEKNNGCKHLTCRCGYEFCWDCGVPWSMGHSRVFCRPVAKTTATTVNSGTGGNGFAAAWWALWFW